MKDFKSYLEQNVASEYYTFYTAAKKYELLNFDNEKEKRDYIQKINQEYCLDNELESVLSLNFDAFIRFKNNMKNENYDNIFADMIVEVRDTLVSKFVEYKKHKNMNRL